VRVVVDSVHVEACNANAFQIFDQHFELAEDAHLVGPLRRQGAFSHAVFHQDASAALLAHDMRTAHDASLGQLY
jgi:hypothetical protein